MKKRKLIPLVLIILLILGLGIAYALYQSNITLPNEFKSMTYNIVLEEEFYDTWGTKKITLTNRDPTNTPVVLRVSFNEIWSKTIQNQYLTLDNTVNGVNVVQKNWTSTFLNDFILDNDGWYYYKKTLNPEQSIQILNSIALQESIIQTSQYYQEYHNYDYELTFNYEAIQTTTQAIQSIWGKNATISGGNVTWST